MYLVTGASGWVGKATLNYLINNLNVDPHSGIICLSSKDREFTLNSKIKIRSKSFDSLQEIKGDFEGVFHLAFLTKDYASSLNILDYISINRGITTSVSNWIAINEPKWVVSVSSGAVFDSNSQNLSTDVQQNPYGVLKLEEERALLKATSKYSGTSIIGRLWAGSGQEMPIDAKYALSDFISQAITHKTIEVSSDYEVWRRYIDVREFIQVLHSLALQGEDAVVDSGGELVELGVLAEKIAESLGASVVRPPIDKSKQANNYYPTGLVMNQYSQDLGIRLADIDDQIVRTIEGHRHQMFSM